MRVAVPCEGRQVAVHFGHAAHFAFFDADPESGEIASEETVDAPRHQPGLLPQWLAERGAKVVLAGGMGSRARELFEKYGIKVRVGAREDDPKRVVEDYLKGTLSTDDNPCDH